MISIPKFFTDGVGKIGYLPVEETMSAASIRNRGFLKSEFTSDKFVAESPGENKGSTFFIELPITSQKP